ncbi:MAG: hypothetical protein BGO13_07035 [Burkholderiales bacterium 66-5]|nr:MAG: hypothetical protein BGO13_07035 [Burkholderiales bacterium 66-5]
MMANDLREGGKYSVFVGRGKAVQKCLIDEAFHKRRVSPLLTLQSPEFVARITADIEDTSNHPQRLHKP